MLGEVLRRDVFPADVRLPDESMLVGVRAFVTSHRLIAWAHDPATGEMGEILSLELVEANSVPASRGTLNGGRIQCNVKGPEDVEGIAWVNAGVGCGCGSPLKRMGPPVGWTG